MSTKYNYPFTFPIENDINIHIEHLDERISCIWFDNNNNEEQNIPNEFKLYNDEDKKLNPFRNTQSYAIHRNGSYKIKYNNKTIIKLSTLILPSIPPIIKNEIKIFSWGTDERNGSSFIDMRSVSEGRSSNNDDSDYSDDDI